jgi:hypothetical protein
MIFILGTASRHKLKIPKKSITQLFFPSDEIDCPEGPLRASDLTALNPNLRDDCDVTFLMMACEFGCITATKALLRCGVEIDAVDKWGHSALHYAGGGGHGDCIEELLVAGTNWKIRGSESCDSMTPAVMAASRGNSEIWDRAFERATKRRARSVRARRKAKKHQQFDEGHTYGLDDLFEDRAADLRAEENTKDLQSGWTQTHPNSCQFFWDRLTLTREQVKWVITLILLLGMLALIGVSPRLTDV